MAGRILQLGRYPSLLRVVARQGCTGNDDGYSKEADRLRGGRAWGGGFGYGKD